MRLSSLALLSLVACSKLTAPPAPEPIASDTPVTAAATMSVPHQQQPAPSGQANQPPPPSDLKIDDIVVGKGPAVQPGDTVTVHYTGTLLDGTKFDSSHDHPDKKPFVTQIPGRVIDGWNKGIPGMHVGGKRRLTIPPSLGYGPMPQPKIPANSTLVFDIELLDTKAGGGAAPPPHTFPRPHMP
jgi:FKBP-type peptidyl-prolyl cis-trans isomerase FkpA